jgi:hypothetical protein
MLAFVAREIVVPDFLRPEAEVVPPLEFHENPKPTYLNISRIENSEMAYQHSTEGFNLDKDNIKYYLYILDTHTKNTLPYDEEMKLYIDIKFSSI